MGISDKILAAAFLLTLLSPNAGAQDSPIRLPVVSDEGAEYVSLFGIVNALNLDASFDIITQRGRLYRGPRIAVYQVGMAAMLVNGQLWKYPYPVKRLKGDVLMPAPFCPDIMGSFYPEYSCARRGDIYLLSPVDIGARTDRRDLPIDKIKAAPPRKDRIGFIVIDPGHGGKDPGAIGKGGTKEKWITLAIARTIRQELSRRLTGTKIVLTRDSDKFIELGKRADIGNSYLRENVNGIFVSVHVNASISPRISGFETYFLSQNPSNEEARATATLENNVIILENNARKKTYDDVEHMEALMFTTQIQKESFLLAESIQSGIDNSISEFKSRGVRKADFFVLRGSLMPAALVEVGYITNKKEASSLNHSGHQARMAEGITEGIIEFMKKYDALIKNK